MPPIPIDPRRSWQRQHGQMLFTLAQDIEIDGRVVHRAGERIQMAVLPADVTNQQEELDTYLGGYKPFSFIADEVSKLVPCKKEKGTRRDFSKENAFEVVDTRVGRMGAINEIDHLSQTGSYACEEYALACYIPWSAENDAADLYDIRAASGELIVDKLALFREVMIWDVLTTAGSWNAANRTTLGSGATYWDIGTAKNPRKNLHDRVSASAQVVTDIWMNPDVAFWFLSDTEVRAHMRQFYGDNTPPASAALASETQGSLTFLVPGLPPIHTVPAKKLSGTSLVYILGDAVVLTSSPPGVPRNGNQIATHYSFRYRGRSGTGTTTNEYMPQGRGLNGGTMYEVGWSEDPVMTSDISGGLILDVLST